MRHINLKALNDVTQGSGARGRWGGRSLLFQSRRANLTWIDGRESCDLLRGKGHVLGIVSLVDLLGWRPRQGLERVKGGEKEGNVCFGVSALSAWRMLGARREIFL